MAQTALVKDLLWRASILLGDTAPQFQRFSELELVGWADDGSEAICSLSPVASSGIYAIKCAAGYLQSIDAVAQADYTPYSGAAAGVLYGTQVLELLHDLGVDGVTPGSSLRLMKRDVIDALDPSWPTRAGTPEAWMYDERTPTHFMLYPGLSAARWVRASICTRPKKIPAGSSTVDSNGKHVSGIYGQAQSSSETIKVRDEYFEPLLDYIVARGFLKDSAYQDSAKARYHTERFISWMSAKIQAITGKDPEIAGLPGVNQEGA